MNIKNLLLSLILTSLSIATIGCGSTFREKHYFRSVDGEGKTINYFRVKVRGNTFLSNSRYISGYYDEKAVDEYFGEIIQPDKAKFTGTRKKEGTTESLETSLAGRKLVLLLSSNSDEIASNIGTLAKSEQITSSLVRLAAADRISASSAASSSLVIQKGKNRAFANLGDSVFASLNTTDKNATERAMLLYINALAANLGHDAPFSNFDAASEWLTYNRGRLIQGE